MCFTQNFSPFAGRIRQVLLYLIPYFRCPMLWSSPITPSYLFINLSRIQTRPSASITRLCIKSATGTWKSRTRITAISTILFHARCQGSRPVFDFRVNWMQIWENLPSTWYPFLVCTSSCLVLHLWRQRAQLSLALWRSLNWSRKCLTPGTWWPPATPVTVAIWPWGPSSGAKCPWRKSRSKWCTHRTSALRTSSSGFRTTWKPRCVTCLREVSKCLPLSSATVRPSKSSSNVFLNNSL